MYRNHLTFDLICLNSLSLPYSHVTPRAFYCCQPFGRREYGRPGSSICPYISDRSIINKPRERHEDASINHTRNLTPDICALYTRFSVTLAPSLGPRRLCFKVRSRALYRATESVCAASTTITCKRRNRHNELLGCTLSLERTYTLYKPRGPLHLRPRDPKLVTQRPIWLASSLQTVLRVASLRDARTKGVSREWYSGRDAPVSTFD